MKKATVIAASTLAVSVFVFLGVAGITWISRANGSEWWPGTDAASNWPAVLGFASMNLIWVSGGVTLLLLLAMGIRGSFRARVAGIEETRTVSCAG